MWERESARKRKVDNGCIRKWRIEFKFSLNGNGLCRFWCCCCWRVLCYWCFLLLPHPLPPSLHPQCRLDFVISISRSLCFAHSLFLILKNESIFQRSLVLPSVCNRVTLFRHILYRKSKTSLLYILSLFVRAMVLLLLSLTISVSHANKQMRGINGKKWRAKKNTELFLRFPERGTYCIQNI